MSDFVASNTEYSSFFRAENAQIIILFEILGKGVAGRKGGQEA